MLQKSEKKEGIIINRMYVGDYLSENLGHEVINLLKSDDTSKHKYYLYLNPYGNISKEAADFDYMLLVRHAGKDRVEIIGMATGLTMAPCVTNKHKSLKSTETNSSKDFEDCQNDFKDHQKFITNENISYGTVPICEIFAKDKQQNILVTCIADEVKLPKKRVFLQYAKKQYQSETEKPVTMTDIETEDEILIILPEYNFSNQSLKTYITPNPNNNSSNQDYYKIKDKILENPSLWEKGKIKKVKKVNIPKPIDISLFEICKIQNDENAISNALAYFMKQSQYRKLWKDFFESKWKISLSQNYSVEREFTFTDGNKKGRIDLLIQDDNNVIVIENKIKSDINSVKTDEKEVSQLNRYFDFIKNSKSKKRAYFFILCPNYNIPKLTKTMDKVYKIITYKDLYHYLNSAGIKNIVEKDANFKGFLNLLKRHTNESPNGYLYDEMMDLFYTRLRELI